MFAALHLHDGGDKEDLREAGFLRAEGSEEVVPAGSGPQAWWHKRAGWYTLQRVVRDSAEKVVEIFDKAVGKWINS